MKKIDKEQFLNDLYFYIKKHGEQGTTEDEKFITLPNGIELMGKRAHNISYFENDDELYVYCVDDNNNGAFYAIEGLWGMELYIIADWCKKNLKDF